MRHIVNTAQEQAWNGYEGEHWARHQERWDAVNGGFDRPLLTAAALSDRDQVLDIGCGAGRTTRLAAQQVPDGAALGLDLSEPMLTRGRASARREGVGNVSFVRADAQVHDFVPGAHDVAISRFGVMFFDDPVAAFANIARALRPGGRLAFVCPAEARDNEWLQALVELGDVLPVGGFGAPGGPGMFSLSEPDAVRSLLSAAGFEHVEVARTQAYGTWGRDAEDATEFMLGSGPGRHLLGQVDERARERARHKLTGILRAHRSDGAVRLRSSAWLITAHRPN
ncbi:class I SAM-dependent methyltransferase [Streptomyces sp. NPDC001691]|uniref:class I SAM-dependent methyltransferase n=1 Tax=Streptomyces sp. NPDC001691 TaxID=3364600 RepID=UPI00368A5099